MPDSSPNNWTNLQIPHSLTGRLYGRVSRADLRTSEREIRQSDIVFIHLLYRFHAVWAARVAGQAGVPVVIVPHGGLDPWVFTYRGFPKKVWLRTHRNLLFGEKSTVLFATEAEARKAERAVNAYRRKVFSWPVERRTPLNGYDERAKGTAACRKLLFVGRLHPMKRVLETIRALRSLNRSDWTLTIAGPPSPEISGVILQRESGELWGHRIHYLGEVPRDQLGPLYAQSDALLLFSHRENFGCVVAEAMCEGLPVAISDGVDIHSLVAKSGSGMVESIDTEEDIARALTRLLDISPADLTSMGIAGAKLGSEEFRFESFADSLNNLVIDCVSGRQNSSYQPASAASPAPPPGA
jgi:glycosyltransferase involved in cell wall biosynthesis